MKRAWLLIGGVLATMGCAQAEVIQPLVHVTFDDYWQTTGSAGASLADVATVGGLTPTFAPGVCDGALDLTMAAGMKTPCGVVSFAGDGVVNSALNTGLTSFTLTFWFNTADPALTFLSGQNLLIRSGMGGSGVNLRIVSDLWGRLRLAVNDSYENDWHWFNVTDRWTFVAVAYDGTQTVDNVSWYRGHDDGTFLEELGKINNDKGDLPAGALAASDQPLIIANADMTGGYSFDGLIDEIRIFDHALTSGEIAILHSDTCQRYQPVTPVEDPFGALVYLPFDIDWGNYGSAAPDEGVVTMVNELTPELGTGLRGSALDLADAGTGQPAGCLLFGAAGTEDTPVETALNGLESFTLCGWFNTADPALSVGAFAGFLGRLNQIMLRSYDSQSRLVLNVNGLWTPVDDAVRYAESGEWIFWAVTYDGTQSTDNVRWYKGRADDESPGVQLLDVHTLDAGPLTASHDELVVGNLLTSGAYSFGGLLDEIRIFGSSDDAAGALDIANLQRIYRHGISAYPYCDPTTGYAYTGDLNGDCTVDLADFVLMAQGWLLEDDALTWYQGDLDNNGEVEMDDFAMLSGHYGKSALAFYRVDELAWIFPDMAPEPMAYVGPIHTPRRAVVPFLFAVMAPAGADCQAQLGPIVRTDAAAFSGTATLSRLVNAHVEANSAGPNSSGPSQDPPPASYWPYLTREAPFDVAQPVYPFSPFTMEPGHWCGVLVEVDVPADAAPGQYQGQLVINGVAQTFTFDVHDVTLDNTPRVSATHQLSVDPVDLTNGTIPQWWSLEHWQLVAHAASVLQTCGDSSIHVPLVEGEQPAIQTHIELDGSYSFDYTIFDQWIETFLAEGFTTFHGNGLPGAHWIYPFEPVYAINPGSEKVTLFPAYQRTEFPDPQWGTGYINEAYIDFIELFFQDLYPHLVSKGWTDIYYQQLLGEPRRLEDVARLADMCRAAMPGIKIYNEVHAWGFDDPSVLSPYLDYWLMPFHVLAANLPLVTDRSSQGLVTGLYTMASPTPPWPNRHMDRPLSDNRLIGWLMYMYGVSEYHHWAPNRYRGADEYATSIGPLPNGSQDPGHMPGDNWLLYRTPAGLVTSMSMVNWRQGLIDYGLLTLHAEHDQATADAIRATLATSGTVYEKDNPENYHQARQALLNALDTYVAGPH